MPKISVNNPQIPDIDAIARRFLKNVEEILQVETKAFMEEQLKEFKARIVAQNFQSFHAEPLSPRYRARKRKLGLPLSTMIATSTYLKAIRLVNKAKANGTTAYIIEVDPSVKAKDLKGDIRPDITVAEIAMINEFGSQRLENRPPARPHWAPFVVVFDMEAESKRKSLRKKIQESWQKVLAGKR